MKVGFEVKMSKEILFEFLIYHTYRGIKGILLLAVGVICWIAAIVSFILGQTTWGLVLVFIFVFCLLIIPIILWFSAREQMQMSSVYRMPIQYSLEKDGLEVVSGEKKKLFSWKDMSNVLITPKLLVLYRGSQTAFMFPKEDIGIQKDSFMKIVTNVLGEQRIEDASKRILPFRFSRKNK